MEPRGPLGLELRSEQKEVWREDRAEAKRGAAGGAQVLSTPTPLQTGLAGNLQQASLKCENDGGEGCR